MVEFSKYEESSEEAEIINDSVSEALFSINQLNINIQEKLDILTKHWNNLSDEEWLNLM